jgi:hypothetical protein
MKRPFKMWLYPLPPLLAIVGFLFVVVSRQNFLRQVAGAAVVVALGTSVYVLREMRRQTAIAPETRS